MGCAVGWWRQLIGIAVSILEATSTIALAMWILDDDRFGAPFRLIRLTFVDYCPHTINTGACWVVRYAHDCLRIGVHRSGLDRQQARALIGVAIVEVNLQTGCSF